MTKYADDGTKYCRNVLSGRIIAGEKIKQACQRHMNDLKRIGHGDFPYYYDQKIVKGAINFVRMIPDIDTKQLIEPQPFQAWILAMILGWRKIGGGKRFRKAYLSMSRTNSKTQLDSWLGLYDFYFGMPRYNRQITCAASSNEQAEKVLDYIKSTIETLQATNELFAQYSEKRQEGGVQILWNKIKWEKYHATITRISPGVNNIDSNHYTLAIVDEGHQLKDDAFVSKISSGQVSLPEALLIESSTAGTDPKVPLHSEYELLSEILEDKRHNDRQFIAIFEQDDVSEIDHPETWEKSNPLLCYAPKREAMLDGLIAERDSKMAEGKQYDFFVKNMNLWQNAKKDRYLNLDEWAANVIDHFSIDNRVCYVGYDKSMTSDDTSIGFVFPYIDGQKIRKFHVAQFSFIPTQAAGSIDLKENQDGIPYRRYEQDGFCEITKTKSGMISDDRVYEWLIDFVQSHRLKVLAFCYDAWHADRLTRSLANNTEWKLVPVRQGAITLNAPTRDLKRQLINHTVTHLDDKILEAAFMNAILTSDNNGVKVDKNRGTEKIDAVDAIMDAYYVAMYHFEDYDADFTDPDMMTPDQLNEFFQSDDFGF